MEKEGNNLFQVNLKGMIALLSEHIYSNPNTFVRELLQNCVDAITALRNIDENYAGRIDVFLNDDKTVIFRDNGIGLKEEEVYRFLTVIGESSKRDTPDADDFIGRFGIGLLSCFVVTDEIKVESRSAMGGQAVCWCGKVDGTYELTSSAEERPIGSQVVLHPKNDWMHLFEYDTFKKILVGYGEVLPYPIYLHHQDEEEVVNTPSPVWLDPKATRKELLDYGAKVFQSSALDVFRIRTESGRVEGVLYVLPFRTQFSVRNSHKVYLKRMLLSEDDCNLLPQWAFFIRCLVNADGLLSMDYLPFETNKGVRSFGSIRSADNVICYTRNLEDFRQVRRIAGAQGWLVVNAAYTFDETLLKKYARLNPELTLDEISPSRLLEQFGEVEAKKEFRAFEVKANELLKRFGCVCRLKHFTPADIPVIFVAEEKESTTKSTNNPLAAVLGTVNTTRQIPPTLTFNADNEMVRTLLQIQGDNKMFQHVVHILYVQSLLQGKYPVNSEEMELFNHSLSELMTAKMNDFINFLN